MIRIVKSDFDTFAVERVFIGEDGPGGDPRALSPRAIVSGSECLIESKPGHLDLGLAFCQPIDPTLALDWPVYTDVEVNGRQERWWNMTDQTEIVRAAKRFQELQISGRAEPGMEL